MNTRVLPEDHGHVVCFSEYGNPAGIPILNFHGGPGSGSKFAHTERFDLDKCRVILFDQRGCGKSTPLGETRHNTTDDILSDAERIREVLGIQSWFVGGSSWGSTCALLYAIRYKKSVLGLLLSAVFLADADSVAWSMSDQKGVARLMPDVWARRMEFFGKFHINTETQNEDILAALDKASPDAAREIAAGVINWEGNLVSTQAAIENKDPRDVTEADIASVKIFLYFEMNHAFLPEGYILDLVEDIADLPAVIVHGRYDILCPIEKAWQLKMRMKNCEMFIAASSGHSLTAEGETIRRMAFGWFLERQLRR